VSTANSAYGYGIMPCVSPLTYLAIWQKVLVRKLYSCGHLVIFFTTKYEELS